MRFTDYGQDCAHLEFDPGGGTVMLTHIGDRNEEYSFALTNEQRIALAIALVQSTEERPERGPGCRLARTTPLQGNRVHVMWSGSAPPDFAELLALDILRAVGKARAR